MNRLFLFSVLSVFILLLSLSGALAETIPLSVLTASGKKYVFTAETAKTAFEQARGLMFRKDLSEDSGMLFDFKEEKEVRMWMKNTYISLDMLFISAAGEIIFIAENTKPLSLTIISAPEKSRYVLEIKGGTSERLGIKVKDKIIIEEESVAQSRDR